VSARSLGRAAAVALAMLVVAAAILAPLLSPEPSKKSGSVASSEPSGRRAALLLLRELGFAAEAWRLRPGLLPGGPHLVWLARAPGERAGGEAVPRAETDPLEAAREAGPGALRHYRDFVDQGGTLLLPAGEAERDFLVRELGIDAFAELDLRPLAQPIVEVHLDAERFDLPWGESAIGDPASFQEPFEPLLRGPRGELLALELLLGRGRIAVLADQRFLDNARLGERDSAVLLVRLVERFAGEGRGGRVLFDEGALGRLASGSPIAIALGPRALPFTLHALALLVLLVWRTAWVREFPRDPEPLEQLSPLVRAQSQAALLARGKKAAALAKMLREGTLERVSRRLEGSAGEHASGGDAAARVRRLAAASGAPGAAERWHEALLERPVADLADLATLDRDLRTLEAEAGLAEPRSRRTTLRRHALGAR
jgi:hypothetical protein